MTQNISLLGHTMRLAMDSSNVEAFAYFIGGQRVLSNHNSHVRACVAMPDSDTLINGGQYATILPDGFLRKWYSAEFENLFGFQDNLEALPEGFHVVYADDTTFGSVASELSDIALSNLRNLAMRANYATFLTRNTKTELLDKELNRLGLPKFDAGQVLELVERGKVQLNGTENFVAFTKPAGEGWIIVKGFTESVMEVQKYYNRKFLGNSTPVDIQ